MVAFYISAVAERKGLAVGGDEGAGVLLPASIEADVGGADVGTGLAIPHGATRVTVADRRIDG